MINELQKLAVVLNDAAIQSVEWHRLYKPIPKVKKNAPCIRFWLSEMEIVGAEFLEENIADSIRKYGNNQYSYPAMNICSLYRVVDNDTIKIINSIENGSKKIDKDLIRSFCKNKNWSDKNKNKYKNCFHEATKTLSKMLENDDGNIARAMKKLISITTGLFPLENDNVFFDKLEKFAFNLLETDKNLALKLLFYKGNADKTAEDDQGTLSIVWDIEEWRNYSLPIGCNDFSIGFNKLLVENEKQLNACMKNNFYDAFGEAFCQNKEPMPTVKLAGGFESSIYTMFDGQPCQNRYGNFERGFSSYPLSPKLRAEISKALSWIGSAEQDKKTWLKLAKGELIFVYPSKLPEIPMSFVGMFGSCENADNNEDRFLKQSEDFIKNFYGLPKREQPDFISLFVLEKIDKARTKVIYSDRITANGIIDNSKLWKTACCNIPNISWLRITEKIFRLPFPNEIAGIINTNWVSDGAKVRSSIVKIMHNYQGINLFLGSLDSLMLQNFTHSLLINYSALALWLRNISYSQINIWSKLYQKESERLMLSLRILGLLLSRNNCKKELYMENYPFLLGQLLQLSDRLHIFYCQIVRDNNIPTQLIGGSLYRLAAENPLAAMNQLGLRINPYILWANSYIHKAKENEPDNKRALVRWALKNFNNNANKLKSVIDSKIGFNDFEKAQLLLGYLADLPKSSEISSEGEK